MIGGYASARTWNAHYAEQERKAGERAIAKLDERKAEILEAFPRGATWSDWYEWSRANLRQEMDALYMYGVGAAYQAGNVYQHFLGIVGKRAV